MPTNKQNVWTPRLFLAVMILSMASSQICLKLAGMETNEEANLPQSMLVNRWFWVAIALSALGLGCWLLVLRSMQLSEAYPWTALIYVITPLASVYVFHDYLNAKYFFGMASIVLGVLLTTAAGRKS